MLFVFHVLKTVAGALWCFVGALLVHFVFARVLCFLVIGRFLL